MKDKYQVDTGGLRGELPLTDSQKEQILEYIKMIESGAPSKGHREAALAGKTQSKTPLEEAQASIRAARFAPSLSSTERYTLLRDGITRLYKAEIKVGQVKNILHINNR